MNVARCLLLAPLVAVIALSGCKSRSGSGADLDSKSIQLEEANHEVDRLTKENETLKTQLLQAREQLAKNDGSVGGQLKKLLGNGEAIEGTEKTQSGGLALNEDFAFAKGSADLSPEGKKSIEKIAARLNSGEYAADKVIVEGHTDDSPVARASTKEKYVDNWGLSGARAAAVIRAFQAAGVEPKRIRGQFRGEYAPRGGDKNANRRVEIYLGE